MKEVLEKLEEATGGNMTLHRVVDGDGEVVHSFGILSMPLRKDHWIYQKGHDGFSAPPPMPFRMGSKDLAVVIIGQSDDPNDAGISGPGMTLTKEGFRQAIRAAGMYAVRGATMHGTEMDFDPDALLQNLVVGFLGYFTETGLGGDAGDDPPYRWEPEPDGPRHPVEGANQATGAQPL